MYFNGQVVIQDYKEGNKWWMKSAEQGYYLAQYKLGLNYYGGKGVIQDYKEAVKWFKKGAHQRYPKPQFQLGLMYSKGQGVSKDYVMAHMYWNLAAVNGIKSAIKHRGIVEKKMTPSQLEKAQDLAREWKEREYKLLMKFDLFGDIDTSFLDDYEENKTENSSPEKDILTNKSQTNNS